MKHYLKKLLLNFLVIFFFLNQTYGQGQIIDPPKPLIKPLEVIKDTEGNMWVFAMDKRHNVEFDFDVEYLVYFKVKSEPLCQKLPIWGVIHGGIAMPFSIALYHKRIVVYIVPMAIDKNKPIWGNISATTWEDKTTTGTLTGQRKEFDLWSNIKKDNASIYNKDVKQVLCWKDTSASLVYLKMDGSVHYFEGRTPDLTGTFINYCPLWGTNLKQLACETSVSGYKVVFALSNDGSVYHIWGKACNWSNWVSLEGDNLKKIDVSKSADGRLFLFAIGGDNDIYERHQLTPEGVWSEWQTMLGRNNFKDISVTKGINGLITVFGLHIDGSVEHIWQTEPGSNTWSDWGHLYGGQLQSIKCDHYADGRLIVVAIGGNGKVYYRAQAVAGGYWDDWVNLTDTAIPVD